MIIAPKGSLVTFDSTSKKPSGSISNFPILNSAVANPTYRELASEAFSEVKNSGLIKNIRTEGTRSFNTLSTFLAAVAGGLSLLNTYGTYQKWSNGEKLDAADVMYTGSSVGHLLTEGVNIASAVTKSSKLASAAAVGGGLLSKFAMPLVFFS